MKNDHPNVIVFFTDQQRWDTTSIHGNPLQLTPNFDRMATEGTHLFNSFTCQPVCGPARSCLQTGRFATETGVWKNGAALDTELPTLATIFGAAGYQTGYIGKWHLSSAGNGMVPPEQRAGYDDWLASNILEFTSDAYQTVMYNQAGEEVRLPGYRVDALTDSAIRYVHNRSKEDRPFFLFTSFLEPHFQNSRDDYPAPTGYQDRYTGSWMPPDLGSLVGTSHQHLPGYYGMVKRIDEALGRLFDALKSLDLLQSTIVLFTSDHGCHFKTRNNEYKRSCHESSIRVPTALTGPGFNSGGRIQQLTSLIDLPRTLIEAAGLDAPEKMRGDSICPLISNSEVRENWDSSVFVQISESQVGRAIRTQRWKYSVFAPDINGKSQAKADHYEEQYLYDLKADPYELNNLVGSIEHKKVSTLLKQKLLGYIGEVEGEKPIIKEAKSKNITGLSIKETDLIDL